MLAYGWSRLILYRPKKDVASRPFTLGTRRAEEEGSRELVHHEVMNFTGKAAGERDREAGICSDCRNLSNDT